MPIILDGTLGATFPAGGLGNPAGAVVGTTDSQTLTNKTLVTPLFNSAQFATVVGTAPIYACRAWVNFNGTGTVAIRASGNVSSITDDGVGVYRINFTTAMVDANYATNVTMNGNSDTANTFSTNTSTNSFGTTTTYSAITTKFNGGPYDSNVVSVSIFR